MEEHNVSNEPTQRRRKRRRGGQPGNRNGIKHGFYSSYLTPAEQRKLRDAGRAQGLKHELDFMRVKLGSMVSNGNVTLGHLAAAMNAIARLATVDHRITGGEQGEGQFEDLRNLLERYASAYFDTPEDFTRSGGGN